MTYNPQIHHRRSIRLKGYDYSQAGAYFVTFCTQDRNCIFGKIENDEMILNEFGQIAYNEWVKLSDRFQNMELDVFQVMPNHFHAIIVLTNNANVGAGLAPAQYSDKNDTDKNDTDKNNTDKNNTDKNNTDKNNMQQINTQQTTNNTNIFVNGAIHGAGASPAPTETITVATVGDIVGAYKSLVANECLKIFKSKNLYMGKLWQRNYYENIIRNNESYQRISDYIINNPAKWNDDKFFNK